MPLKTPWVCILYWAPQRMGVAWLSLSYPVPWLQTQRGKNKAEVGPQAPFGNAQLQQKECFLKSSQDKSRWFLGPSTGATPEQGFVKGRGPFSPYVTTTGPSLVLEEAVWVYASQTSWEKSQWLSSPASLFTIQPAERTAANISGMSRYFKFHIKCKGFLSATCDSVFTR